MPDFQIHQEGTFEDAIVEHLTSNGWTLSDRDEFDAETALDQRAILEFIKTSQPHKWERYKSFYGNNAEQNLIARLYKEIELRGILDVVRHGIDDSGIKFHLAYFKPDTGLNPDTLALYETNRLYVTRQVKFAKDTEHCIDILFSLNGLPIATAELKNQMTGQNVTNAIKQYRYDRDPREKLFQFKKRAVVHFAVDSDEVYFATKLDGDKTRFFPFNRGYKLGAGNPPNEDGGYKTEYFWKEVLARNSFLEIVGRFLHLEVEEILVEGAKHTRESMIFPRYHQLDAARKLAADGKARGSGNNYLIQHSAGSGKSNTIAWLAYRLSSLYSDDDKRIFDSVIVVTDRTVLDQQLQNTIYQFDHKQGVVQKIDEDSQQLAAAITHGTNIIITTLQKFPFALNHLADVPGRQYAVIIDEAHSSQGGNASRKMNEALADKNVTPEEAAVIEDQFESEEDAQDDYIVNIRETIRKQKKQPNISMFAFTATPKTKTLEVFGTKDESGKPKAFHLYSMRQAIEEGFILDVLKNYTTYKLFYRLSKAIDDDPELSKKKATSAIARFVSLHPYNLAQKTEVIVEHFRHVTMPKIGGKAKAMVVTSSRKHAVRYYFAFKKYLGKKGYNIKPLVAFSGKVIDDEFPDGVTEAMLNGFGEKELPKKFATSEFQILLVADKYQTGFDQPLLHTMYVDKKLSGVRAVQTLSRLNRIATGKEDTFILDFVNDRQEIIDSFQPYYEVTTMDETADPNHLYDLKNILDAADIYHQSEIDDFARIFYDPKHKGQYQKVQGKLYGILDIAVDRYKQKPAEKQDEIEAALKGFVNLYSFLSQIMPFQDVKLEKLYSYGRMLLTRLPKIDISERLKLDNEVDMQYYRLQKMSQGDLLLEIQGEDSLRATTEVGVKRVDEDPTERLSNIITLLNDKFGTEFNDADKLFFDQIEEEMFLDEKLREYALANPSDTFQFPFNEVFINKLIDRMDSNQDIFERIMGDSEFKADVSEWLREKLYERFRSTKDSRTD
jgi:type I restriction enzyme, R subunit